jgi:serine/threonine-protein kinase
VSAPESADDILRELAGSTLRPVEKTNLDSRAWLARIDGRDVFLKFYAAAHTDDPRVDAEVSIAGGNLHPSVVPLWRVIGCADGTLLVYDCVDGENLGDSDTRKRFHRLPLAERRGVVRVVVESLAAVCDAGFTVVDWYWGNMLYDFDRRRIWLFDWELCRRGDGFILEMDENYGTSRLMAPEEFRRGSRLDQRTLVFNLGRYALLTLPELAECEAAAPVLARATYPSRGGRYDTVRAFLNAWTQATDCHPRGDERDA